MSENETLMVGIVSADDGSIKVVISAPKSPPLLGAKTACGAKGVPISDTVSRTPPSLSDYTSGAKDASVDSAAAAAEPEPTADTVDSDTAKAIFAAHEPSANADFWSKLARPTDPPTAPDGVTKNDPVLKPVTKVATALKPAAAGGAPLPSIKEEKPARAGDADWTVSAKEFPKEKPATAGLDWTVSTSRNKTERKGEVKSTKVFNKYDLLDDAETNVKAEVDEDEDEKGKEKGANSGKQPSFESVSPESVSPEPPSTRLGFGFGFGKLCSSKLLCIFFTSVVVFGLGCSAFALSSKSSGGVSEHYVFVPDATAVPVVDFSNITPESMALPTAIPNEVATSPAASSPPGHVLDATMSMAVPQDQSSTPTGRSTTFASIFKDEKCPQPAKACSFVQDKKPVPQDKQSCRPFCGCNDLDGGSICGEYYEECYVKVPPRTGVDCPSNYCPCIPDGSWQCRGPSEKEKVDDKYLIAQCCSENTPSQTCKGFCATSGCEGSCSDKTNKDHGYYCCCSFQGADLAHDCGFHSWMDVDGKWMVSGTDKPDLPYEVEDDPFFEKGYECENTFDKVKKKLKDDPQVPPLGGEIPFSAGWAFATATAEWAREVLGLTKEDMPLHYAFYTNGNRSFDEECNQPDSKIFASCEFLHSQAEAPAQLGEFAINLLNMTAADMPGGYWTDDKKFNDSVLNLSYTAFAKFINYTCGEEGIQTSSCNNVCVPGSMLGSQSPQPSGDCGDFCSSNTCSDYDDTCPTYGPIGSAVAATDYDSAGYVCCCNERTSNGEVCGAKSPKVPTLQEFAENNVYRPFFGSSSGGGSGGSLKVSCVGKAGHPKDILVSAGGGGGGGYTSPQMGDGMDAGGGAGAGAQIGAEGCAGAKAMVGAGAGNHPAGFVEVHKDRVTTPADWVALLDEVKHNMTDCWYAEDKDLVITGEGNGGFGFQHLQAHNILTPSDVQQVQNLSIGFRFAFAMGQGNDSLIKDTQWPNQIRPNDSYISGAKAYVVCECNGKGDCKDCVSPVLYPNDTIGVHGCASIISTLVCQEECPREGTSCKKSRWEEVFGEKFKKNTSKWTSKWNCCKNAVKDIYTKKYIPSNPGKNNPFCPGPNETSAQDCDDPAILVTEDKIEKNQELCPTEEELAKMGALYCKPLPGCPRV